MHIENRYADGNVTCHRSQKEALAEAQRRPQGAPGSEAQGWQWPVRIWKVTRLGEHHTWTVYWPTR